MVSRYLLSFALIWGPLFTLFPSTPLLANASCQDLEVDAEFNRDRVFAEEYAFILENSGFIKQHTLPFLKHIAKFVIDQRCVNCNIYQFRAKVARYLNQPYLFANYAIAAASAGGVLTTLFTNPAEGSILATWYGKFVVSTALLSVSAYTGSQLQGELNTQGRQNYFRTKVVTDARKIFPGFDRVFVAQARDASFTTHEQGMEHPLSRTISFMHGASSAALRAFTSPSSAPSDPARYIALGILDILAYHPEFIFAMNNRGKNPYDFVKDTEFDTASNMLLINTVQSEIYRKLFYSGQLKDMQSYLKNPTPAEQVVDFNPTRFRDAILTEIKTMMKGSNMAPLSAEAEQLLKIFLVRTFPHMKTVITKYQLEKPKNMTDAMWKKYLEDNGFAIVENDPYVNDSSMKLTAYHDRIINDSNQRVDTPEHQATIKKAMTSPFIYFFRPTGD